MSPFAQLPANIQKMLTNYQLHNWLGAELDKLQQNLQNGQVGKETIEAFSKTIINKLEDFFSKDGLKNPNFRSNRILENDFALVKGQSLAKRALEIASAGGHNILLIGPPGSGKTLLARAYPSILPEMSYQEIVETTQIYSLCGLLQEGKIVSQRPFRAPHHSSSYAALVGGGSKIKPGEVSLAHRGVLFLDEFPEFDRETLEALRQPLEDGFVTISRASGSLVFPARFSLLAAANPTPSGFDSKDPNFAKMPQQQNAMKRYLSKFSGPIMDRIDIYVQVDRPSTNALQNTELAESSYSILKRVEEARSIQINRYAKEHLESRESQEKTKGEENEHFSNSGLIRNAEIPLSLMDKFCILDEIGQKLLSQAVEKFNLSARSYMRIRKLARTIADLDQQEQISSKHVAEALQYRSRLVEI